MVTGRELVDLPLNGRNFTQLGLLQTGVAPLTAGVATAGGSLRQGQAYAVNGMRPEQNVYLVDGAQNMNRMDGGYALQAARSRRSPSSASSRRARRPSTAAPAAPPRASSPGRAATSFTAASTSSCATTPSTRATSSRAEVEPLKQNQFGGTVGGPVTQDRLLFFGYYEGFRNKQGMTTTATVPTAAERQGDFSGMGDAAASTSRPAACRFPATRFRRRRSTRSRGTSSTCIRSATSRRPSTARRSSATTTSTRPAAALDFNLSPNDQFFARYSYSGGHNINPISVRGTDVPGFPTRDDIATHAATAVEHAHRVAVADQHRCAARTCATSSSSTSA